MNLKRCQDMLNQILRGSLLKPLLYLQVRHAARRSVCVSSMLVGFAMAVLFLLFRNLNVIGSNGIVVGVNGLFQALPGFYIAALAAIATFDGSKRGYNLDEPWETDPAILDEQDGNERELTRRHFLALLFGYLSFSSLFIYFLGLLAQVVPPILRELDPSLTVFLRVIFGLLYGCWVSHVIFTTCLGLYFLAHRFHTGKKPSETAPNDRLLSPPSLAARRKNQI
jgi:hypothetical protein